MNTPKLQQLHRINRLHRRLEDNESFLKFLNQCVLPRGSQRTKEIHLSSVYDQREFDVHISDKSYNHHARNI